MLLALPIIIMDGEKIGNCGQHKWLHKSKLDQMSMNFTDGGTEGMKHKEENRQPEGKKASSVWTHNCFAS